MLHRYSIFVALCGFAALLSGAFITSSQIASGTQQTQPNSAVHSIIGIGLAVATLGLAIWIFSSKVGRPLNWLVWSGCAALALNGAMGWRISSLSQGATVLHACLGHLFIACVIPVVLMTSPRWSTVPVLVTGSPYLRPLAATAPAAVFVQITLGALYRHQFTGIMPHMAGAMIVSLLTLGVSAAILQNHPQHRELKQAAAALISVVLAQICLGVAVFLMLLLNASDTLAFTLTSTAHVTTGALTLAASLVLAITVWRSVSRVPLPR